MVHVSIIGRAKNLGHILSKNNYCTNCINIITKKKYCKRKKSLTFMGEDPLLNVYCNDRSQEEGNRRDL